MRSQFMRISLLTLMLSAVFFTPVNAEVDDAAVRASLESQSDSGIEQSAADVAARIETLKTEIAELESQIGEAADDAAKAPLQDEQKAKQGELDDQYATLKVHVAVMKERGLDVGDYQTMLLETGDFSLENLSTKAVTGMFSKMLDRAKEWLIANGPGYVVKFLLFIGIMIVFGILSRIAGRMVKTSLEMSRLKTSELLKDFFVNVVTKVVMIAGLLIGLMVLNVPIAPLLAGIGVLGFVVGFALQDTLGNFAAGIMLLLYRPYDVGDVVTAGGVTGKVTSMSLVSTTIGTPDNQVQTVPNGTIWGGVITNVTANDTRRVDLTMGIGYDDDIDKAEAVIREVVTSHELVLKDPEPAIKLNNLGESSVDFIVRPWTKTGDYWTVYWDLTKALKQRFDKEGISIPYPQRDIHIIKDDAPDDAKS